MPKKNHSKLVILSLIILSLLSLYFLSTQKPTLGASPQLRSTPLTRHQYDSFRERLLNIAKNQTPREALLLLRNESTINDSIMRDCHNLAHDLGHNTYESNHNFAEAIRYGDETCNSGYLHGVIESHFTAVSDITDTLEKVCDGHSPEKFLGWQCFHGVGHGLMYFTENDLPRSIKLCGNYQNRFARLACINGVFMENFNSDQKVHVSEYLNPGDPFYPCPYQNENYRSDCYSYAPAYYLSLNKNNYLKALAWCDKKGSRYKNACSIGVGRQAIKENINRPTIVESVCLSGEKNQIEPCISGMIGLYINHFGSLKQAQKLCPALQKNNQKICKKVIGIKSKMF